MLGGTVPVKDKEPPENQSESAISGDGPVDVLVRPEGLTMQAVENGNGIVTHRTFLGSVTRVRVMLSGDVAVQIDKPSSEAAAAGPGHVGLGDVAARAGAYRPPPAGNSVT